MAYTRNNYGSNSYQGSQNRQPQQNFSQQKQLETKKSGATYTKMRKGKMEGLICVNAWRKTKNGLMTASAFPVDGHVHVGKDKGHEFMRYVVNIANSSLGTNETFWCLMRLDTKMIVIKELSLVISPNGNGVTSSGKRVSGFFGANFKRR